jgi:hypothetical protein
MRAGRQLLRRARQGWGTCRPRRRLARSRLGLVPVLARLCPVLWGRRRLGLARLRLARLELAGLGLARLGLARARREGPHRTLGRLAPPRVLLEAR